MPFRTKAYAALEGGSTLVPFEIERRDLEAHDVHVKIKFCGVCHSDWHTVQNEWPSLTFPVVPGHEIVGTVERVGPKVTTYEKGCVVAVGNLMDSCGTCSVCTAGEEQYCTSVIEVYGSTDANGKPTNGGYSKDIVVKEHFVCRVPDGLCQNLPGVAPLLCAGITTYAPMVRHGMNYPGKRIGVLGLGGLGHMALKFGIAWGAEMTVISSSDKKREEALNKYKAKHFIVSSDMEKMAEAAGTLDFIIDTISFEKDMSKYLSLLGVGGLLVGVGLPANAYREAISNKDLISRRLGICGSLIGGMRETQEMLDFCADKAIYADVEIVHMKDINSAFIRMLKSDVRYRFVVDVASSAF